jgi:hypothetical protein
MLEHWWGWLRDAMHKNGHSHKPAEPLLAALEHIQATGGLAHWVPDRAERVALMAAMMNDRLVEWDRTVGRYALTPRGRQCLSDYCGTNFSEAPPASFSSNERKTN